MRFMSASAALLLALSVPGLSPARADDGAYVLTIKDHRFEPGELTVPVDKRVQLTIDNQDATAEEFESHDLRVEKVIAGHTKGTIWVGPLPAGEYKFFGEFHEDTAKGKLIAK